MTSAIQIATNGETISTRLFGTLNVDLDDILGFAEGIPGFPGAQRFVLLTTPARSLRWLQSLDDPSLAFLLVDYARLATPPEGEGVAHAIVTMPGANRPATANLRAPVLINHVTRTGEQVILTDSAHTTAEPVDLDSLMHELAPSHS